MKIPIKVSFFIIVSDAKKIKKICKKLLTLYLKSDIIIMGENNNKKKRSTFGSQKKMKKL